jgi:aspartate/methionine/tyrosine aminotransferase
MAEQKTLDEVLNDRIKRNNPVVYQLLSRKGQKIFFPKGILYQGWQAKEKKVAINATLGTALEEDGSPMVLRSVAENINIDPGEAFPYANSYGIDALRVKWKKKVFFKNTPLEGKAVSKPVVTNALTHGLNILGYLFVDEGDEIILSEPYWGNYNLIFNHAYGAALKKYPVFTSQEEGFNIDAFKGALEADKTGKKIILLNFPNNPSGYTPTTEVIGQLKEILLNAANAGNQILVIIDDAYFGLVYEEGVYRYSFFSELADLHENLLAVKVDGVTKEEFAWGLRVGFLTFGIKNGNEDLYEALESKTAGVIRGSISNASHLSQSLVLKAFYADKYIKEKKKKFNLLRKRYLKVKDILEKNKEKFSPFFKSLPFNSGYFMCIQLKDLDAEEIRTTLLEKYSTGVIAIGNLLRIAFSSTPTDKLTKLFDNIYHACEDCKNKQ